MSYSFTVASEADLNKALEEIDAGGPLADRNTHDTITLTANITLSTDLFAINVPSGNSLTINGQGFTLDGDGRYRGFFDYAGMFSLNNITIQNTVAAGGAGGGGGAGLGGGLFVASGAVTNLSDVTFAADHAVGGTGGTDSNGGGGLGGAGGAGGGGGGVGSTANGAGEDSNGNVTAAGAGIVLGAAPGGSFSGSTGGADGGGGDEFFNAGVGGGGGGVAGGDGSPGLTSDGGAGGFGGGGAAGVVGGNGGFGGGGGGGAAYVVGIGNVSGTGDSGGFGAGAGNGSQGGGGLAAGGAVFVQRGGSLTFGEGIIATSTAVGGRGANAGEGLGGGLFIQGSQQITFAPAADQYLIISSAIADQTGSGGTGADAGAGSVLINGAGVVDVRTADTFSGGISIASGTLSLESPGAAGGGAIAFTTGSTGNMRIALGDTPTNTILNFQPGETIDLGGIGLATQATLGAGNVLTVSGGLEQVTLNLDPTETFPRFQLSSDGVGGTNVTLEPAFYVSNEAQLNAALKTIDVGGTSSAPNMFYTITLTADIALTTDLAAINLAGGSDLEIAGSGHTLDGGGTQRGLFDYAGTVNIDDLTVWLRKIVGTRSAEPS